MRLTFSAPITAADTGRRTIAGRIVTWGEEGNTSQGPTVFAADSITVPDTVKLHLEHDHTRPVGHAIELTASDAGIEGVFKIAATTAGNDALVEATDGLRDGFSVGVTVDAFEVIGNVYHVTASTLDEVSLVTNPAIDSARVSDVAASEPALEETQTPDEPVEDTPEEGETVDQSTEAVAEVTAAAVPVVEVTSEPFPYRPTVEASFFRDLLNARNDIKASERVNRAQEMLTAAQVSTDVADIIPEAYRPDLYVGQLGTTRPVCDAISSYALANANPFRIPVFDSATGMLDDHVEGTNPTDGELAFDHITVQPVAKSGKYTVSREVVEGSTPGIDQIILTAIREAYAEQSEEYVANIVLTGATAGTAIVGVMDVRANHVQFQSDRKTTADFLLLGGDVYAALAAEIDLSGRPMSPSVAASNAAGTAGRGASALSVDGYESPLVWSIDGGLLGKRSDVAMWESGLRTWRWEEKDGPANIEFAAFGYVAAAVLRGSGLRKFALDV